MTTILGVKAFDAQNNQPYVILGTDSRNSLHGKNATDDAKKLYAPQNSNYAFASAGKNLLHYFPEESDTLADVLLRKGGEQTKQTIEHVLAHVESVLAQNDLSNQYVVALQQQGDLALQGSPELYSYSPTKGLVQVISNIAIGSGSPHVAESFHKSLQSYYVPENGLVASPKVVQELMLESLQEASKKDYGTGGQAQFAIITSSHIQLLVNYAPLQKIIPSILDEQTRYRHPWQRFDDD